MSTVNMSRKRQAEEDVDAHSRPKFAKKARTYTAEDAKLAKIYEGLADESDRKRLDVAIDLMAVVQNWMPTDGSETKTLLPDFRKLLTRLFRGLCSNRKAARLGFFTALVEVLRVALASDDHTTPRTLEALEIVSEATEAPTGASKQERRDYLIGRVTAYGAFLQSQALFVPNGEIEAVTKIAEALCEISRKEKSLRQECGHVLFEAVRSLGVHAERDQPYAQAILGKVVEAGLAKTPEGVAIWIETAANFTSLKLPKDVWKHKDPLHKKELQTTFSILKQNLMIDPNEAEGAGKSQLGARQYRAHFTFSAILSHLKLRGDIALAERFWKDVFDDNFFAPTASAEKKAAGFQTFADVVPKLPSEFLAFALSANFVKSLINQSAKKERLLHQSARRTLNAICDRSHTDGHLILPHLISGNGTLHFDKVTGTKTISTILQQATPLTLLNVVKVYEQILMKTAGKDEKDVKTSRQTIADHFLSLFKTHSLVQTEHEPQHWIDYLLKLMARFAYIQPSTMDGTDHDQEPEPPLDNATARIFHHRLSSSISQCLSKGKSDRGPNGFPEVVIVALGDKRVHKQLRVLQHADEGIQKTIVDAEKLLRRLNEQRVQSAEQAIDKTSAKQTETEDNANTALVKRALCQLLATSLIQAYGEDTQAIALLDDLQALSKDMLAKKNKGEALNAIMDIILDYSSRQSTLHRQLAEQTFEVFAGEWKQEHLTPLFDVLDQKEGIAGQQALFDPQDDDREVEDESEAENGHPDMENIEVDSDDSDVEMVDGEDDTISSDEQDQHDADSDKDIADDELHAFNAALAQTLRTDPNAPSDDEGSDSDMDDEAMMALEPALAEAFKARASAAAVTGKDNSKKQQARDAKQNITAFKNRVLDLLDIFVRQRAASAVALGLVAPLLKCMRTTTQKQLGERASALLRLYFDQGKKSKSRAPTAGHHEATLPSPAHLWEVLRQVHEEALWFGSKAHAATCSSASLFLARAIVDAAGAKWEKEMAELDLLYAETNGQRRKRGSQLPASFGEQWWAWSGTYRPVTN